MDDDILAALKAVGEDIINLPKQLLNLATKGRENNFIRSTVNKQFKNR